MCECDEYNPDYDITLYTLAELNAMLAYYRNEIWTIPPFSKDEIEEEIKIRTLVNG